MNRTTTWAAAATMAVSALALATPAHGAPATTHKLAGAYEVTAKVDKTVATSKETVLKVRGRVTPKAAGQKVVLQQRVLPKKTWKATGTTTVKQNGTYVIEDDPSTPGTREYRVVKPASNGVGKGISDTLSVKVYGWQKLVWRSAGVQTNVQRTNVFIGADYFTNSLATVTAGTASSIEYTLGRKCTQLRATYALTDESASGASGTIGVSGDGAALASHPLAVGTVVKDEVIDVSDVFRLKFDLSTSPSPKAVAAVATPEVLCAG
jgi:hypothetical protein